MPKLTGPLFSLASSGRLKHRLTFSERKEGSILRYQRAQKVVVPTFSQADQQSLYRLIYARWFSFSENEKSVYNNLVKQNGLRMSGWNYFLKLAMADPKKYIGLTGSWTFNRTGEEQVLDISKNGNHGILKPTFSSNSPQYTSSKNKKLLNALSFDGIDDYVETGNTLNTPDMTILLWFKSTKTAANNIMHHAGDFASNQIDWILDTSLNELYFRVYRYTTGNVVITANKNNMNNGKWHFIVATIEGTTAKLYVDGEYRNEAQVDPFSSANYPIRIGARPGLASSFFLGTIDNPCMYNRALAITEITTIKNLFK